MLHIKQSGIWNRLWRKQDVGYRFGKAEETWGEWVSKMLCMVNVLYLIDFLLVTHQGKWRRKQSKRSLTKTNSRLEFSLAIKNMVSSSRLVYFQEIRHVSFSFFSSLVHKQFHPDEIHSSCLRVNTVSIFICAWRFISW